MRAFAFVVSTVMVLLAIPSLDAVAQRPASEGTDWSVNMTVLETCSCPLFCQCSFTGKPPADCNMKMGGNEKMTFCRFNQAYKVNSGHFGSVRLDGCMFWFAGDAGEDFALPRWTGQS